MGSFGRDDIQLLRCAKAYISSLCSPEHQQTLEYPLELHEDIEGKKDGLEHKYEYKAALIIQQRGMVVVSGSMEEVLMVVSYLEDEINQWRLRLHDISYFANIDPQTAPSERSEKDRLPPWENQYESIPSIPDAQGVQSVASGRNRFPDLIPASTTEPLYERRLPTIKNGGQLSQNEQVGHGTASHSKPNPSTQGPYAQRQSEHKYQWRERNLQPQFPTGNNTKSQSSATQGLQSQRESNVSRWVVKNVPSDEPPYDREKQVHISTPPNSSIEVKRQKVFGSSEQVVNLVTDSVPSSDSSTGSSEPMLSRNLSTGSFRSSISLEFASNAASRQGYTDQEVEEALRELPQDFKTSDLIRTLSRRRRPENSSLNSSSASSQSNPTLEVSGRSSSPFSEPGHSFPRNDPSLYKAQSSSQPLPLASLPQKTPEKSNYPAPHPSSSEKLDALRRRQQELLTSLGPHKRLDIGRLEVDSPPPDVMIQDNQSNSTHRSPRKEAPFNRSDHRTQLHLDNSVEDLMVLTDAQDIECVAAIAEAERMDVDQEVEYLNATFPKGSERPDVVLLTPPRKAEPELILLDDEEMTPDIPQLSRSSEAKTSGIIKFDSPKTSKRILAPTFTNLPANSGSGGSKVPGSLPVISNVYSLSTLQSGNAKNNPFKTLGYSAVDVEAPPGTDEFDSLMLRSVSPVEGAAEDDNQNGRSFYIDKSPMDSSQFQLSSINRSDSS
ncbi:uncharacterized protein [Amphiura filiformis]|uniref:uncharacterized protein n=1 Tax=Amphiura filiformis TaxID=82378 RepID=UPI003B20F1CF